MMHKSDLSFENTDGKAQVMSGNTLFFYEESLTGSVSNKLVNPLRLKIAKTF